MVLRGSLATREYIQLARSVARAERGPLPSPNLAQRTFATTTQTKSRTYATTTRRPPPAYLPAVWTFSPINTGNPIYDEPLSPTNPPPAIEPELTANTAPKYPAYDPLAPFPSAPWSTSLCNTGNPIFDHFFNTVETAPTTASNMSDADYEAFLNKASADVSNAPAPAQTQSTKAATVNTTELHPALKSVKATYTSDTDADFEPVSLSLPSSSSSGAKLSEEEFSTIANTGSKDFEVMDVQSFDPHGQFKSVVQAVEKAAGVLKKDISVFRAENGGARCEYWILAVHVEKGQRKAVGFKVDAVES